MIRVILTIESRDGNIHTRLETDGAMLARADEIAHCEAIRTALRMVAGRLVRSAQYTKDLPPSGGEKQQQKP